MTYEEMEAALANATLTSLASAPPKTGGTKTPVNSTTIIKSVIEAVAPHIVALEKQVAALQTRIEELERKGYCGVWKSGKEYSPQSEVTHDGARWISHKRTSDKPGASADWTLTEKRSDTTTSPPRTNGHYSRPRTP
jgi:hypothetical protein